MQDRMIRILSQFDLTNTRAAVYFDRQKWQWRGFVWSPFYKAERQRAVDIEGCAIPISTLRRLRKYIAAGYTVQDGVLEAVKAHIRLLRREQWSPHLYSIRLKLKGANGIPCKSVTRFGADEYGEEYYYESLERLDTLWTSKADLLDMAGELQS